VTFITAQSFLNVLKIPFDGFMVAALALMESPAIVIGVVLARLTGGALANNPESDETRLVHEQSQDLGWGELLREAFLNVLKVPFDGFMVAALALMESPAIVIGVVLARVTAGVHTKNLDRDESRLDHEEGQGLRWGEVLREAFLNGSIFLLIGSLLIGYLVAAFSPSGVEKMEPFTEKLFYGALCFFLLDMGLIAAQRLQDLRKAGAFLIGFAVLAPVLHALVGLGVARLLGLNQGDALLFMVLCASASYIAVPAAMRMTVPQANPSLYISTSLGVTFPFNVVVGIPVYMALVQRCIPAG